MDFVHGNGNISSVVSVTGGNSIQPGSYPFDLYLNNKKIDNLNVTFVKNKTGSAVYPCFSGDQLIQYGVNVPEAFTRQKCINVMSMFTDSKIDTDINTQKITLIIPQIHLINLPAGTVPQRLLDNGINAGFVNYNFNYSNNKYKGNNASTDNYSYLSLNNGVNLGAFRFRQNSNLTHSSLMGTHWTNIASWAETDIIPWRSRVLVGQAATSSEVFDSFQFRGAQMSSVEDMLPDSMRNYAPVVRGVANSNARVTIRQNGYLVYSTTVPPGPFAIHDVYPNRSGTLYVTVSESDGSEKHFEVPYASVANMLREGVWHYQITAGRYNDGNHGYSPDFIQSSFSRGTSYNVTPYGGVLIAENYRASVAGIGTALGSLGAVSIDGTYAQTNLASGDKKQGQSYRLLYSKSLNNLGTEFRVAGYRYSTSGYYDLSDAVQERRDWKKGYYESNYTDPNQVTNGTPTWAQENNTSVTSTSYANKKERMEVAINQSLGDYGSFYVNASQQRYWNSNAASRTVQLGYNGHWDKISYGVYWQSTKTRYNYSDNSVNVTLSIPFNFSDNTNSIIANTQLANSKQNGSSYNTGVSGTLLDDSRLSYGVSTGNGHGTSQNSSANLAYRSNIGNFSSSYSYSNDYQQASLSASGGVVLHSGGIALSQPLGNTFAIVKAKNASGTQVINSPGVVVNNSGYAIVSNVTAYRYNTISLSTDNLKAGLDIPQSSLQIVPSQGAIVRANFQTFYGLSLLIHSHLPNGGAPQIGANVYSEKGVNNGTVGTDGTVFVSGTSPGEQLTVKWGDTTAEQCYLIVPEDLSPMKAGQGYLELNATCQRTKG
ncbi:fimbria/pilus outer membrane usher protein [Rosenbergiella gaditana]|nr:fimbria/pilus outer membrane usher protein [Rosenbergiella gaditana]